MATSYLQKTTHAAPLAVFRIIFGLMVAASLVRFAARGWIDQLYIKPTFFFSFYGFEWVKPLGNATYLLFAACLLFSLLVAIGLFYRVAATGMFLSFTYIELMDKTTYLNHYYFVSLISFLLIFLPAHVYFSADASRRRTPAAEFIPRFTVDVLKLMMAILYFYAGLAKLNSDWLIHAEPLKTWLPAKNDLPVLGPLLSEAWVAYLFSWFACFYDLTIVFWLMWKKTRVAAYITVIVFHGLTALLFPIGMFPFVMMVCTLVFFPAEFHRKIIGGLRSIFQIRKPGTEVGRTFAYGKKALPALQAMLVVFFIFQLVFPLRYLLYPGELFWNEEGYRFSWRVMLMEKTGYSVFELREPATGRREKVNNEEYLTRLQEKQMSFQPDMILEYAHHLAREYEKKGWNDPGVYVQSYVTLNGRPSRLFVDSTVNLAAEERTPGNKKWILPLNETITGF